MNANRHRHESGVSSAEYIGTLVVAALLVGAIVLAMSPQGANVRAKVCEAVGSILQSDLACGSDGDDSAEPPVDEDFEPPVCQLSQSGESYNSVISIAFIDIGENAGLTRTVMSDGTIILTASDGGSLGASGGIGADAEAGGGAQLGASLDFGGGVNFNAGDSWEFSGDDAEQEAEDFENLIQEHQARDITRKHSEGAWVVDLIDPLDPLPDPDTSTTEIGLTGDVEGELGINLTGNEDGSGPSVGVTGFAGSLDADAKWTETHNTQGTGSSEDDSRTYTVDMSINPDVASDIWQADLGLGKTEGMSMAITENASGQITEVSIVTTSQGAINEGVSLEGGGSDGPGDDANSGSGSFFTSEEETTATVTTTTLSLDPESAGYDEDAAVVQDWLGGNGSGYSWPGLVPMSAVNPAIAGDDPFSQLMHEQATLSAITSEGVTSTTGFAAEVALGLKLGFDFSAEESEAEAVYAAYLGAPDNGERTMVPYDDCIS